MSAIRATSVMGAAWLAMAAAACHLDGANPGRGDVVEVARGATSYLAPGDLHAGPVGVGATRSFQQWIMPYTDQYDTVEAVAVDPGCTEVIVVATSPLPATIWTYVTIPPDDYEYISVILEVSFTPSALGFQSCGVTIEMGSGMDHAFVVDGTGVTPVLAVSTANVLLPAAVVGASTTVSFDVENASIVPPDLVGIAAEVAGGAELAILAPPSETLSPGASSTVEVGFLPTQRGIHQGALRVTAANDAIDGVEDLSFWGYATTSIYSSVTPGVFGERYLHVFDAGDTSTISLYVIGEAPVTVTSLAITGGGAADFSVVSAPVAPFAISPGGAAPITIGCSATLPTAAHLEVASDAPDAPVLVVPLTCAGRAGLDQPWDTTFAPTPIGGSSVATLVIESVEELPLYLFSVSLTGDPAFSMPPQQPVELAPESGYLAIQVAYAPTTAGTHTAYLYIESNNTVGTSTRRVDLTGTSVPAQPEITLLPPAGQWSPGFGEVLIGATSPAKMITVLSDGGEPLVISAVAMGGGDPDSFVLLGPTSITLQPDETAEWYVRCAPQQEGTLAALVSIYSNDATEPISNRSVTCSGVFELSPDAGLPEPDGGESPPDAGAPEPDAGATEPDAGPPEPDAGAMVDGGGGGGCGCAAAERGQLAPGGAALLALLLLTARSRRPTRRAGRR